MKEFFTLAFENVPHNFFWLHLIILGITLLLCIMVVLIWKIKGINEKIYKIICLSLGLTWLVLFIIDMILHHVFLRQIYQQFQWWAIPFGISLVTTTMILLLGIVKRTKVRLFMMNFVALFGFTGGFTTIFFIEDIVYVWTIVQVLVLHMTMLVVGLMTILYRRQLKNNKPALSKVLFDSLIVYVLIVAIAYGIIFLQYTIDPLSAYTNNSPPALFLSPFRQPPVVFLSDMWRGWGDDPITYVLFVVGYGSIQWVACALFYWQTQVKSQNDPIPVID